MPVQPRLIGLILSLLVVAAAVAAFLMWGPYQNIFSTATTECWTMYPLDVPNNAAPPNVAIADMRAIAAISADDAWAAGNNFQYRTDSNAAHISTQAFIMHFESGQWKSVPTSHIAG